ncbi:MAG: tetratricopeptide repeat protein [Hyphomonas sp.]|uniref:tetratricopeptide repeat protein n=1 Tax=Hyphomonas sp. TaxID=87 RepID=UPI003267AB64
MRTRLSLAASVLTLTLSLTLGACATEPAPALEDTPVAAPLVESSVPLSPAARATAVIGANGLPVGISAYPAPLDAVKAGDMAAFLQMTSGLSQEDRDVSPLFDAFLALDRAADGDTTAARNILKTSNSQSEEEGETGFYAFLDAWLLAMDGKPDQAIERHRGAAGAMPGLTGDLSLAAMLEALDRPEQALAVYEFMTPAEIEAPEHQFDPKGLLYSHIRTVVSRHALLLQRLGRIEEAKAVYQKLADAEPEEAISYAAAIESLETGKNLDNEALDVRAAFTQSLADVSRALQEQRIIRTIMMGGRIEGFDDQRSAFDQVALLINPDDEGLRAAVIDQLYESALYGGVAHVALSAPTETASLQIAAAQALIMSGEEDEARATVARALEITDEDDRLQTLYGALQLRTLLNDQEGSAELVDEVISLASNQAERASAHGLAAEIKNQFGDLEGAARHAAKARELDDTHDRRMMLANSLGKIGEVNQALAILRTELLGRPNDPYTLNSLGYFLIEYTDKQEEGFKVLYRARSLAERDPYITDSLGWAYFRMGHLNDAQRLIEQSRADLKPHKHWEIETHLGDIYWHQGKKEDAREAWQNAIDNHPPAKERAELEDKLATGLTTPKPERRSLPSVSIGDGEVDRQDI